MNRERQLLLVASSLLVLLCVVGLWVLRPLTRRLGEGRQREGGASAIARGPMLERWFGRGAGSTGDAVAPVADAAGLGPGRDAHAADAVPGHHLVRERPSSNWETLAARVAAAGGRVRDGLREIGIALVELPPGADIARVLEGLDFELAGPNHVFKIPERDAAAVQLDGGDGRAFRDGYLSWLGVQGDNSAWGGGVLVAVIDGGVAGGSFRAGQVETVDLVGGAAGAGEGYQHGLAMASIIGGPAGVGIAPGAQILDLRVLDPDGYGDAYTLAEAILIASRRGADIINLSLGSYADNPAVREALEYAIGRGAIVVASAGNDGAGMLTYPARYSGVISVGAIDAAGGPLSFSNAESGMDYAAPGLDLVVSLGDGTAITISGTSPSAAALSGVLAAVRSWEPSLGAGALLELLGKHANDLDLPGVDDLTGRGTVDLQRVAERERRGIYDVALSGLHLDAAGATEVGVPLVIAVQNRGTEFLPSAQIRATVGVNTYSFTVPSIRPGESRGQTVSVSLAALRQGGAVSVDAAVTPTGVTDTRLFNNRLRSSISVRAGD